MLHRLFLTLVLTWTALAACRSVGTGDGTPIRVLCLNMRHGLGMDGAVDLARVAALIQIRTPDVVVLQEVDRNCQRSGNVDQAARLADLCGMRAVFGPFMTYDGGQYGMALLTSLKILSSENHALPPGPEPRTALAARLKTPAAVEFVVIGVHFWATEAERLAQATTLVELFEDEESPMILAGDLNSEPGSPVLAALAEHWTNVPKSNGPATFPADDPDREIDHVLVAPADRFARSRLVVLDQRVLSDHRPLVLDTLLRP